MQVSGPHNMLSFKVILVGDSGVGKTSIANRIAHQQFLTNTPATIGTGTYRIVVPVENTQIELKLWDTAGQEKYKSIIPMFKRETSACIIVASVDSTESVEHIVDWNRMMTEDGVEPTIFIAVNKTDLNIPIDDMRDKLMNTFPEVHFVSAKSNYGINELFNQVAYACFNGPVHNTADSTLIEAPVPNRVCCF